MEDMKARDLVGSGWRQKSGSSSSSNSFSEEDSAEMSSGWTVGVQTACKQLLYALVIFGGHKDSIIGRKDLIW